jgi:hypothetical protein
LLSPSLKCVFVAKRYYYWFALLALTVVVQGCVGSTGAAGSPTVPISSAVQLAPGSLSLTGTGSANAKTFFAFENFYSGTLTESDTCNPSAGILASVSPSSGTSPATFTVTPRAVGACTVKISDANGQSATESVSVASGTIVLAPTSLSFLAAGSGFAQTFTASETGYPGTFTQTNTCNPSGGTIATVSPASGTAPVTFTVTPQSAGTCTITVSDSNGQSAGLTVTVTTTSGVIH